MKQIFVSATFAIALAAFLAGCASETTGPSESGSVNVNLLVGDTDVTAVSFEVTCDDSTVCPLSGQLNVVDDRTPPVWATIMDLPVGDPDPIVYTINLSALDDQGDVLCTGSANFTVEANDTKKVNVVLTCGGVGEELLGNVDIDATFQIVDGNRCPRLHFLNAVPNNIPEGRSSAVTVLVSDADGDPLTTALTATSGSFADAEALSTTYTCDSSGAQTISVLLSDGDAACDKTKSFEVECGGDSLICEYVQDFERLDHTSPTALSDDGWVVFGNVFAADGTTYLYGYGSFPAPNGTPGFSSVAAGEGGPDQGAQQLVIYSDYDNFAEQIAGNRVQANTYQERTIVADDVGNTFMFSFDAKRGNINEGCNPNLGCESRANAFIRTVDPGAGFTVTNDITVDTTGLLVEWMRYSIEIEIDAGLVGQLLQFGFSATASNFEGSGNFYDNVTFGPQDCVGECAIDADCPDDGNECTATVCSAGSCETSNAADGTACNNNTGTCNAGICQPTGPIEVRPLPEIYTSGTAINYSAFRDGGPGVGEIPSDEDVLEDLGLLQSAGYNLLRLFGADAVSEKILQLAATNFPEMRFQQGIFLEGLSGAAAANCDSAINDSQIATAIQLATNYSSVVTVSVGNETSFFSCFMPLNCLEGYINETRNNVTQPVTADDDYTFYTGQNAVGGDRCGSKPDTVLPLLDFVSIHMYPFSTYREWDWRQLGVSAGPERAEAMMNASLARAQQNYQAVFDYQYMNASGTMVTVGESLPIVVGETGWKWRQTNPVQQIEFYAADPVNAKWYYDLMRGWERSPGGPPTIFIFEAFDEAWKQQFLDDGWGFWDEDRMPNYVLCNTPVPGAPLCNDPLYAGAGFFSP